MKGLMYKNYLITKKYYFISLLFFFIMALFMFLVRLSMICGNISHDPEAVDELTRSMWVFRYMPCAVIILAFTGTDGTTFTDLNTGWTKFSFTTSLSKYEIVGATFLSKGIAAVISYAISLIYLVTFCLSFGDEISLNYISDITALFFLGIVIQYYSLTINSFVNKQQTAQAISFAIAAIFCGAFCIYMFPKVQELDGKQGIVLMEWLAQQFAPFKDNFFIISLICAVVLTVGGYFTAVKCAERRKF